MLKFLEQKLLTSLYFIVIFILFRLVGFWYLFTKMRKDPWVVIHLTMSFTYVTCGWYHFYVWFARMSQAYFMSCFFEFPLLWQIFVSILLPDWFPFWFDFYEVPGVENRFIQFHPDKLIHTKKK